MATVYEAETEGMEGKILNVKAKAMTVERKEPTDLQDIKQQIELLATIMKIARMGGVKLKEGDGVSSQRRKKCFEILLRMYSKGHLGRGKGFLNQDKNL